MQIHSRVQFWRPRSSGVCLPHHVSVTASALLNFINRRLGDCFSLMGFQVSADELDEIKEFLNNEVDADFRTEVTDTDTRMDWIEAIWPSLISTLILRCRKGL